MLIYSIFVFLLAGILNTNGILIDAPNLVSYGYISGLLAVLIIFKLTEK